MRLSSAFAAAAFSVLSLTACAGSIRWDDAADVDVLPGGTVQTSVSLVVEGSREGTYSFKATPDIDGITATVDPESGEVVEGEPFEVTVTIQVAETVTDDSAGVYVEAVDEGGEALAGTRIFVNIEQPAP